MGNNQPGAERRHSSGAGENGMQSEAENMEEHLNRLMELLGGDSSTTVGGSHSNSSNLPPSLAHLPRARVTELDDGEEDKDADAKEKPDSNSDSDSSSDSDDSEDEDGASGSIETSETAAIVHSVAELLKAEQASLEDKLSSMLNLQQLVLKMKEKKRGSVAKPFVASGLLDAWTVMAKQITDPDASFSEAVDVQNWKIMEIIFQLLVKVSDKSNEFSKQVASADLITCTIKILKSDSHREQCIREPYIAATNWMIELIGNCYDDFTDSSRQEECCQLVDSYLQVECESIQIKSGQMKLVMALKDQLRQRLSSMGGSDGTGREDSSETLSRAFSDLLENLTQGADKDKQKEKEAEHMCRIGMPRVFTENIKGWYRDPDKWRAFNENGKMWKSIQEWFKAMVTFGKVSSNFSEALCEAGIVEVLMGILSNTQIQDAYMRNTKTREVVAACLLLMFYAVQLKRAPKYMEAAKVWDILQVFLVSEDVNIKGHAFLIVANMSKLDASLDCFNMSFSTVDAKLLIATYMAYKSEGGAMGDFLAHTNFAELCVQDIRNCLTRDPGNEVIQEDEWEKLHQVLGALHIFSSRSDHFARALVKANIVEPLQTALSSPYFQARQEEENCRQMLKVSVLLIHNCVRLEDPEVKSHFLVVNLWPHIYPFSIMRETEDHKHFASFLAFTHMYALVSDGTNRPVTIDQFPDLSRSITDIKYINRLWHTAKSSEEKILGDYLAATGGARVHVELLGDLVADLNAITSNENKEKTKPLLANMNNLALESAAFAEELCRSGLLGLLESVLTRGGLDLTNVKDAEKELFDHSISTAHACAQYPANMRHFRETGISIILCKFMMADLPTEIKRRAMKAVIYLRRHDPSQVDGYIAQHRVSTLSEKELDFFQEFYHTCKVEKIQGLAGDLLIELGIAETLGRKLQQLVQNKNLVSSFVLTLPTMNCLWNYTDTNRRFSQVLRDVGIFQTCQEIIRNPELKENLEDEKINNIVTSALSILLNSAQCEANHTALYNLRVLNDLLQFTKAKDPNIKSISTLAMSFLIREENAHLVRSSSKSGVVQFLLERLEAGMYRDEHRSDGFASTELLGGLSRVALNDGNKVILVYDGILPILSRILVMGEMEEKQLAANLTWSLTFQEDNKYSIQGEQPLIDALETLAEKGEGELKIKAKGALCQLEITKDRIYRVLDRQRNMDNSDYEAENYDIYLSHHPKSESIFSELKDLLKTEGFSVTSVSHDSLSDDLFSQMISCIERSRVVIIETSRQYQQSLFCRTEAEYSHSLLKPFIFIRAEHGFKPASWLARVSMGRPIIDFSRSVSGNEQEARMTQLLKEVKHAMRQGQAKE